MRKSNRFFLRRLGGASTTWNPRMYFDDLLRSLNALGVAIAHV